MYKIKNLLCKILIGIMIFSSIPINAFAENDNVIADDFETITQADESLEEDTEISVEENSEDISAEIEETENPDEVESENPEESESADLKELTENSDNVVMYSDLTAEEQKEVKEQYGVRGATFIDCENADIDLYTTYEIGHALQTAEISAHEYLMLKSNYETAEEANAQLKEFANYRYMFPTLGITKDAECKALFLSGVNCINILSAKTIAYLLNSEMVSEYLDITGDEISSLLDEEDYNAYMNIMQEVTGVISAGDYEEEGYDISQCPEGAFTYDRNGTESINVTTGSVGYRDSYFTLPGENGLDIDISVSYDSSLSSNKDIGLYTAGGSGSIPVVYASPLYNFAAGWSFNFSYIKFCTPSSPALRIPSVLTISDGTVYTLDRSDLNSSNKTEIGLYSSDLEFKDLILEKYTGDANGIADDTIAYRLSYKDGKKEYFDVQGKLLYIVNRFGNMISVKYYSETENITDLGQEFSKVSITGTDGKYVVIERSDLVENYQTLTIKAYDCQGNEIGNEGEKTNEIVFELKYIPIEYSESTDDEDTECALVVESITNKEDMTTSFVYSNQEATFGSSSLNKKFRLFFLMTKIIHPTGAVTQYTYENEKTSKYQYYRITNRRDFIGDKIYDNIDYTYTDNYTHKGEFSVSETNSDGITTKYSYSREKANSDYHITKTSEEMFDSDNNMIAKVVYGEYYMHTYPKSVTTIKYDVKSGKSVDTIEYFEYNEYRDLVAKWSAKASGNTDDEHKTSYEYDDRYHLLTKTTYNQDSDTTVEIVNELNASGTRVAEQTKSLNGQLVFKEEYEYTNSANPSMVKSYTSASDYIAKEYEYDASGLLISESYGDTVVATYENDTFGRPVKVTDGNGNITEYTYDGLGRQIQKVNKYINDENVEVTDSVNTIEYLVSEGVNKVTVTDGNGNKTVYNYDALGKIENVVGNAGNAGNSVVMAQYTYDTMNRVTTMTDGNGNVYSYEYDCLGRKTDFTVTDASDDIVYSKNYDYVDVDDYENSVVTIAVGTEDGRTVTSSYTNKYGETVKEIVGEGTDEAVTEYTYDYQGEVIKTRTPNAEESGAEYTYITDISAQGGVGTTETLTDMYGHIRTEEKDMLGRTFETTDAKGNKTFIEYDEFGRVSKESGEIDEIDGADSIKIYEYDTNGNVIKESITCNELGEEITYRNVYYEYDNMNRLVKTYTDELGETLYEYDKNGNIVKMTTGVADGVSGTSTTYEYDEFNRLIKTTDPMGYTEEYTYDNNGNVVSKKDKNDKIIKTTYNALNKVLSTSLEKGDEDEVLISYTYANQSDIVSQITQGNAETRYVYDTKGLVTEETNTANNTVNKYSYDKDGNRTGIQVFLNGVQTINQSFEYNCMGQLQSVYDEMTNTPLATYNYDANGNVSSKSNGDGRQQTTYSYNSGNMLTKVNNLSITGYEEEHLKFGTYSSYSYEYYADGNIKSVTDNKGEVTNYIYDGAGRLIAERYDNASGENSYANMYRYDERGNRISKQHNAGSKEEIDNFLASINPYIVMLTSLEDELLDTWQDQTENARYIDTYYIYDNNNRLTSQKSNYDDEYLNDKREYTYDNNGNLIHKYVEVYYDDSAPEDPTVISCSKDDISYEYNDLYQLIGVEKTNIDDNEIITEYAYDAAGQRISKTVDGYTTYHIWDNQSNIIGEYGASTATYYRGLGGEIISDGVSHYAYNGHGDTTSLTQQVDNSLVFAETYGYDAFGNTTTEGLTEDENPFRYNGQYTDDETGLIYLRNRYYDPEIGRFISEDPIKDGLNWYSYCGGNPVAFVDPFGLADDFAWFPLRSNVEKLPSSSVSWDSQTSTATINIGGATASFTNGETGVRINSDGIMEVRSDVFALKFIPNNGERVFLGSHSVAVSGNHASVIMMVDSRNSHFNTEIFTNNASLFGGAIQFATIGAGPSDNNSRTNTLFAAYNRTGDVQIITGGVGRPRLETIGANAAVIDELIKHTDYFIENHNRGTGTLEYFATPRQSSAHFNSNSFAHGLLIVAQGITPPSRGSSIFGGFPGWDGGQNLVDRNVFGQ